MRALFITTILPHKKQMGSEVASQAMIEAIRANGVEVDVLGYVRPDDRSPPAAGEIAVQARYIESRSAKLYPIAWLLRSVVGRLPYTVAKYRSAEYRKFIVNLTAQFQYDFVVIDHPQMGWAARSMLDEEVPLVFVAHNVEHEMYAQLATARGGIAMRAIFERESKLVKRMEDWLAAMATEVWTLTGHDAAYFERRASSAKVRELPVPASSSACSSDMPVKRVDVALIGSWAWAANREALNWFLDEVCRIVPASISIQIAGKGGEYASGRYPNVRYIGFVPDAVSFLQSAKVVAIPTLSGGGIQIKTLDAIASGSSIVATSCAVRGILDAPDTVTVADDAQSFAAKLTNGAGTAWSKEQSERAITWSNNRERRFLLEVQRACQSLGFRRPTRAASEQVATARP